MNHSSYDVAVVGGGPAGSALSTLLSKQGYQVLLLEREKFPRFHVGESLLPATQAIWEKLGITESLQNLAEKRYKDSAEFRVGLSPQSPDYESAHIDFTNPHNWTVHDFPQKPYAYQVERSQFDLLLLNHARQQGVTVCEAATVKEIIWSGDKATGVRWRGEDRTEYSTAVKCVADCSGRQALIAKSQDLLVEDKTIQTATVFGHFTNVTPNPGKEQGAISIYFIENGWVWFIPLGSNKMSVGVVVNKPESDWWYKRSPQDILHTYINRHKFLRTRFEFAQQTSKTRLLRNLSYASTKIAGDGWLLVGDANFFVDPFLSSGVQVAFKTAEKAAIAIDQYLDQYPQTGSNNLKPLQDYAKWCGRYKFHVVVTMRLMYRLMESQFAIKTFTAAVDHSMRGKPNRFEQGFVSWALGNFDRNHWSLYFMWTIFSILVVVSKIRQIILGQQPWHGYQDFCAEPELELENLSRVMSNR